MMLQSVTKAKSSTQIVARKQMKKHLKRIRNKEYVRLRDMVPTIANKDQVSKVTVIEEAVRYIDELHRALASRLGHHETHQPSTGKSCKDMDLTEFVHSFIPADFYQRRTPVVEYTRDTSLSPSYVIQERSKPPSRFV